MTHYVTQFIGNRETLQLFESGNKQIIPENRLPIMKVVTTFFRIFLLIVKDHFSIKLETIKYWSLVHDARIFSLVQKLLAAI